MLILPVMLPMVLLLPPTSPPRLSIVPVFCVTVLLAGGGGCARVNGAGVQPGVDLATRSEPAAAHAATARRCRRWAQA